MKQNGKLAKAEERIVLKAIETMDEWIHAHSDDDQKPYGWDSVASCVHQLKADAWTMFDGE